MSQEALANEAADQFIKIYYDAFDKKRHVSVLLNSLIMLSNGV